MHHISSNDTDCDDISEPAVTVDMGAFPPRYHDVSLIGCGSRSLIFSVIDQMDRTHSRRIAVKKVAVQGEKKESVIRQLLREIRILNRLDHQNIVKIHHVLVSTANDYPDNLMNMGGGLQEIDCLYLGMELMDTNLKNILEKRPLDADYIKLFMYQILRGTKYLHSANVIHRDLTPSNILVNMDTLMLKIGDFGVSRLMDVEYDHTYHLSLPLTTKYYQAPELLLHPHHYTKGMDIWSIGCIFLEMLTGSIAFPGENAYEQMSLILETIPVTESDWQSAASAGCMDENCCPCSSNYSVQENGGCPVNPVENFLFNIDSTGINLLKQMLLFDSAMRIDGGDSIAHPYFISYSNPNDEPSCVRPFHIEDEIDECCAGDLQAMLQDFSDSATSSFSRSTDTAASHTGQYDRLDELNSMGLSSGNSIVANGSYRHLLSLAECNGTQGNTLSESEVRKIAAELESGVQIHECSLNKDRMSIDIRPASTVAACFDPYKWDHSASSTVNSVSGKQVMMIKNSTKMNRSLEDMGRNSEPTLVLHVDKCHRSMDVSLPNNLANDWTASSLELSSELKKKFSGNSTPDSADRPATGSSGTITPATHSPVDLERDSTSSQRHSDSQTHQSRRHHHHHSHHSHHHHHHSHHHHHHHHHHHKHKNRHSHSSTHVKSGSEESTSKICEVSSEKLFQALSTISKSEKFPNEDDPLESNESTDDKGVKTAFESDVSYCNGDPIANQNTAGRKYSASKDLNNDTKQTLYANIEGTLTHSKNSAFSRHPVVAKSLNKDKRIDASHNVVSKDERTNVTAVPKPAKLVEPVDLLSNPRLNFRPVNEMRPRTWSEGCFVTSKKVHDLRKFENLMKDCPATDDMISYGAVVERICTSFTQIFKDGLCFNSELNTKKVMTEKDSILWQSRRRHYSDDPTLMSSAKSLMSESTENDRIVSSNVPLITCHGAARTEAQSKSRLECPF